MVAQVKPWGNSQGIRLSKELLALAGIKNNDLLEIELIEGAGHRHPRDGGGGKKRTSHPGGTCQRIWRQIRTLRRI